MKFKQTLIVFVFVTEFILGLVIQNKIKKTANVKLLQKKHVA